MIAIRSKRSDLKDCFGYGNAKTQLYNRILEREVKVIETSDYVHMVDALAITGDEGRRSLR